MTESGGPYGFSLFASLAKPSYSSSGPVRGSGMDPTTARLRAQSSLCGASPMAPNAVATPPTNPRRDTRLAAIGASEPRVSLPGLSLLYSRQALAGAQLDRQREE